MDAKEARNILSDIRDGHLQFAEGNNINGKWLEIYLKEAWACDSVEKHLKSRFQGDRLIKQNQMIPPAVLMKIVILLSARPVAGG